MKYCLQLMCFALVLGPLNSQGMQGVVTSRPVRFEVSSHDVPNVTVASILAAKLALSRSNQPVKSELLDDQDLIEILEGLFKRQPWDSVLSSNIDIENAVLKSGIVKELWNELQFSLNRKSVNVANAVRVFLVKWTLLSLAFSPRESVPESRANKLIAPVSHSFLKMAIALESAKLSQDERESLRQSIAGAMVLIADRITSDPQEIIQSLFEGTAQIQQVIQSHDRDFYSDGSAKSPKDSRAMSSMQTAKIAGLLSLLFGGLAYDGYPHAALLVGPAVGTFLALAMKYDGLTEIKRLRGHALQPLAPWSNECNVLMSHVPLDM